MKSSSAHNDTEPPTAPPRRAEKVDVAEAIDKLTDAEWNRLKTRAKQLTAKGVLEGEWEQILHDAVAVSLEGKRPWYIDTNPTIFKHLWWTLRTVASESREELLIKDPKTGNKVTEVFNPELAGDKDYWDRKQDVSVDVGADYEATETTEIIFDYFKSDPLIVQMLKFQMVGYTRERIAAEMGISLTDFETVRRRMKRGAAGLAKRLSTNKK